MRLLIGFLLLLPALPAADWKVDHATIAGSSLKHLREILDSVGLRAEYGGQHSSGLTEMALISFPDGSYLELMAWVDASAPHVGQSWAKFMDQHGGPCAWAVSVPDIGQETKRLAAVGIHTSEPVESGRMLTDGYRLKWEMAGVGPGDRGSLFPFLIHDLTPRERRVYCDGKPTTDEYAGVARVVIAVKNLGNAISLYRRAYALPQPREQTDGHLGARLAWFPGTPIILAAPLNARTWLAGRIVRFGEAPCAFLLRDTGHRRSGNTIWFDAGVTWFDPEKLEGIQLGVE
jgi:hypothetical protein